MTRLVAATVALLAATSLPAAQTPVFRARTELVSISASVKRRNAPIANLTAVDFALFDNGVRQTIEALTVESVPVDVTLFVDTSHSTVGSLERMEQNVQRIAALLNDDERLRVITIGLSVEVPIPWRSGGPIAAPRLRAVPGISLVYDALVVGLTHQPEAGRRHLIVAMTDGEDCGSVVDGAQLLEVSGRSEAVVHWVYFSNPGGWMEHGAPAWCTPREAQLTDYVAQVARRSGGEVHRSLFGLGRDSTVRTFERLLADFRQSYVLRYSPAGVKTGGWHELRVTVPSRPGATVRSRSGYFAAP